MKYYNKLVLSCICIFIFLQLGTAQNKQSKNALTRPVEIRSMGGHHSFEATILSLNENTIEFKLSESNTRVELPVHSLKKLEYKNLKKEGSRFRSTMIGVLVGTTAGIVVGNLAANTVPKDEPWRELNQDVYRVLSAGIGFLAGGVIGAISYKSTVTIPINGKQSNYKAQKKKLEQLQFIN